MLYEPCPICRGSGQSDDPPSFGVHAACLICNGSKFIEVGLTRQQFDHKLLIADDAELLLRAVSTRKCYVDGCDQECVLLFHGGPPEAREYSMTLPLSKPLRERLIQLVGNE